MANRTKFTPKKREQFLDALCELPNVTRAARLIGMSRRGLYDIREADKDFAQAWDDAVDEGVDAIEVELHRRAVEGTTKPVFQGGRHIGDIQEYSDTLLMFMLKALRPDKYRERTETSHSGSVTLVVRYDG